MFIVTDSFTKTKRVIARKKYVYIDTFIFSSNLAHGFWIPIVSGIPDSLSCIPDSEPRIQNSTSKIFKSTLGFRFREVSALYKRVKENG